MYWPRVATKPQRVADERNVNMKTISNQPTAQTPPTRPRNPNAEPMILRRVQIERQTRWDPLRELTPERLGQFLAEFRAGYIANLTRAIDAIEERDDVLAVVAPKAKASVCRHDWEILTVETQDEKEQRLAARQKETLERFYNNLEVTSALDRDSVGGVSKLLWNLLDAKSKRYSVHHIIWRRAADGYTATLVHVPPWYFECTTGRLRFLREPYALEGEELDPRAWLTAVGQGVGIACAVAWMYKRLPLRDWLIYCSRHGMPGIEGVTDAPEGSDEWDKLVEAVQQAASEFAWVRNRSSEINTIDLGAAGELPYPPLVDRMDRALTALWRGADLSTISSKGEGRGASLQGEEADIIEQHDCAWLSEVLQYKLDRLVLDLAFGPQAPQLAYFVIRPPEPDRTQQDLDIDKFLTTLRHPMSYQQLAERYNRPLPPEDQGLVRHPGDGAAATPQNVRIGNAAPPSDAAEENVAAVNRAFIDALGVRPGWLAPLQDLIEDLCARAELDTISDADLADFLNDAAGRLPEEFDQMDIDALADVIETALGERVLAGARDAFRRKRGEM